MTPVAAVSKADRFRPRQGPHPDAGALRTPQRNSKAVPGGAVLVAGLHHSAANWLQSARVLTAILAGKRRSSVPEAATR